jgi:hypothetical protein
MTTVMTPLLRKSFSSPDEVRSLPRSKIEIVRLGDYTLMRVTFEPGWKWSECIKPTAGTDYCEVRHLGYLISGRMQLQMSDGRSETLQPGDVVAIPPGHDGWVIGNEPAVLLDFIGGETYGQ